MNPLKTLIDAEFAAYAADIGRPAADFATQKDQAGFLGESRSSYNRLLHGGKLSPATAQAWARRLTQHRRTRTAPDLERELLSAAHELLLAVDPTAPRISTDVQPAVEAAFDRLRSSAEAARQRADGTPFPILFIEYRDRPRALKHRSRYPQLLRPAGRALASGVRMALFQPFGPPTVPGAAEDSREPLAVRAYKRKVATEVRGVAEQIFEEAVKHRTEEGVADADPLQIQLYEGRPGPVGASGIATRMFFSEFFDGQTLRREVWEWIAGTSADVFLERDPDSLEWEAFALQFFPVYVHLREKGSLPDETGLREIMKKRTGQDELDAHFKNHDWPWAPWTGLGASFRKS